MSTSDQLSRSIIRGKATALITTWDKVGPQYFAVMEAAVAAGMSPAPASEALQPPDASGMILVTCASCHLVASGEFLVDLVKSARPNITEVAGIGLGSGGLRTC